MQASMDLQAAHTEFDRFAEASDADGMPRFTSPGVEGLQVLFAGVSGENTIRVEDIRSGYRAKRMV